MIFRAVCRPQLQISLFKAPKLPVLSAIRNNFPLIFPANSTLPTQTVILRSSQLSKQSFTSFTNTTKPTTTTMTSIPDLMPAIVVEEHGDPTVMKTKEIPVPKPSVGEILVKNAYSGVNFIDTYYRTGLYQAPLPLTPGREGSGTVVAVHPSVTDLEVGDKVVYLSNNGSYAAYTTVDSKDVVKLPQGLDEKTAAAALLQGLTAWTFVREAGQVQPDDWVLVHAAAGGVGSILTQMLKAVGAKVIATASSDEKCQLARSYGAQYVIQSRGGSVPEKVKEITGGHGVDVIFDGVGKATFDSDLEMIARKGTIIVFGNAVSRLYLYTRRRRGARDY